MERDVEKAYHFAKIAAEYGNSGAQNLIGMINYEGTETLEKNEEMALKWYRKAAKSNEAAALYNLAMLYENGAVVMQNYNEAFKCTFYLSTNIFFYYTFILYIYIISIINIYIIFMYIF